MNAPQLEFPSLPPRLGLAPIESSTELEPALTEILRNLKPEERVNICLDLINFTGELCFITDPPRLADSRSKPLNSRKITLDRPSIQKAILKTLQFVK